MSLKEEIKYALKFDDEEFDNNLFNKIQDSLELKETNKEDIRKSVYHYDMERLATDEEFENGEECIYIKKLPDDIPAKTITFESDLTPNKFIVSFQDNNYIEYYEESQNKGYLNGKIHDENGGRYNIGTTSFGDFSIEYFEKDELINAKNENRKPIPSLDTGKIDNIDKDTLIEYAIDITKNGSKSLEDLINKTSKHTL